MNVDLCYRYLFVIEFPTVTQLFTFECEAFLLQCKHTKAASYNSMNILIQYIYLSAVTVIKYENIYYKM